MRITVLSVLTFIWALPAGADGFQTVKDRGTFLSLVQARDLTRSGISLQVSPSGQISGRALGRDVTGAWRWSNGYFCRELFWGSRNLGPNCQMVKANGKSLRFISDQGKGIHADFKLD